MLNRKTAALLVLNYNCQSFLKDCLDSLLDQTGNSFQIFFIDNASIDGSVGYVKANYPQVKIVENRENVGVGRGFNEVIKEVAKGFDYIGLFNPDIKVDRDWLSESLGTLEKHSEAEICAGLIFDWEGEKVDTAGGTITNFLAGVFGGFWGSRPVGELPPRYREKEFPVFFGLVTAMLTRADAFERFGFFDEDYFMYFEDIDFSWRILLGGGQVLCNPQAVVYHYGHGSQPKKDAYLKIFQKAETNLLITYFKNLSLPVLALVLPPLVLARVLLSFLYLRTSFKITMSKCAGVFQFLVALFSVELWKKRRVVQTQRVLSDFWVLKRNPSPLLAVRPLINILLPWVRRVNEVYAD